MRIKFIEKCVDEFEKVHVVAIIEVSNSNHLFKGPITALYDGNEVIPLKNIKSVDSRPLHAELSKYECKLVDGQLIGWSAAKDSLIFKFIRDQIKGTKDLSTNGKIEEVDKDETLFEVLSFAPFSNIGRFITRAIMGEESEFLTRPKPLNKPKTVPMNPWICKNAAVPPPSRRNQDRDYKCIQDKVYFSSNFGRHEHQNDRTEIWKDIFGIKDGPNNTADTHAANAKNETQIQKDIERTDPNHSFYRNDAPANSLKLKNILMAYTSREDIEYVQGMNDICSVVLFAFGGDADCALEAFSLLMNAKIKYYAKDNVWMKREQEIIKEYLSYIDPALYSHLTLIGDIPLTLLTYKWLLLLSKREFSLEGAVLVMEAIWCAGFEASQVSCPDHEVCIILALLVCGRVSIVGSEDESGGGGAEGIWRLEDILNAYNNFDYEKECGVQTILDKADSICQLRKCKIRSNM